MVANHLVDNHEDLFSALKMISDISKKESLCVFIDEFQEINHFPDAKSLKGELRSHIQYMNKISFVFAGSYRSQMDTLFRNPKESFYKSALPLDFSKIPEEEFYNYAYFEAGLTTLQKKMRC